MTAMPVMATPGMMPMGAASMGAPPAMGMAQMNVQGSMNAQAAAMMLAASGNLSREQMAMLLQMSGGGTPPSQATLLMQLAGQLTPAQLEAVRAALSAPAPAVMPPVTATPTRTPSVASLQQQLRQAESKLKDLEEAQDGPALTASALQTARKQTSVASTASADQAAM